MNSKLNIRLRPIQQNSQIDKGNFIALKKSVAILKNYEYDNEENLNEWLWNDAFKSKSRICYVIEKMPGNVYCGECAVKNISDKIPEIEIELMKKYQGQGIGYHAIINLLNKITFNYGKVNYYAKIEPDNYASQFLFEKLGGRPVGVVRDYTIPDDQVESFTKCSMDLLDGNLEEVARKFNVEAKVLLTHLLIYEMNINDVNKSYNEMQEAFNHRKKIDFPRNLTRKKYKEPLREFLEELYQINEMLTKDELNSLIDEIEKKWMDRVDKLSESVTLND